MAIFAVEYTYSEATSTDRDTHRADHRTWLRSLLDKGVLRSSGPFADGSGALPIFDEPDLDALTARLALDPFAVTGLVDAVRINEWTPVMGELS